MRLSITLIAAALVAGALSAPAFAGPFSDVPTDHWAYDAIDMLQSEGIVEGYPDGTFKGNRSFTRYEMAMVVARLFTRFDGQGGGTGECDCDMDEYKAMIDALMNEFRDDLDALSDRVDGLEDRMDGLEDRVSTLEKMRNSVEWSGMLRVRAEDIVTGQDFAFNTMPGNPTTIPSLTPGQGTAVGPEFEEMVLLALEAHPSDYLDVYVDLWQISSDLDTPKGTHGGGNYYEGYSSGGSPPNQALILDQAYAVADMNKLLGYDEGISGWLDQCYITVGRQYNRFGAFGLTYDNGYESRPAFYIDAYGTRWDLQLMVARDTGRLTGEQEGLGVGRVAYGFGTSHREDSDKEWFAKLGFNYLFTGVGDENGWSVDLDTELAGGEWFPGLKFEWYHADQDQYGNDVSDTFGGTSGSEGVEDSYILGLDVYNNGNLMVNVRGASVGLAPGYSSVDNNPFEEFDALANGIGLAGQPNFNFGYESGINYFPANFEGFGFTIQYTWFEKFFMDLTAYDGQLKSNEADLPAVVRMNARYPLSENSDLGLEYIHAGIDADYAIGKLRGEYLVRF